MRPAGDGSQALAVTPQRLHDNAGNFYKASKDTSDLKTTLTTSANQLIHELSSELSHSPDALQRLCDRWEKAMVSLSDALNQVGKNLDAAGTGYTTADQNVSNSLGNQK